eukprot:60126-Ditylum_brightwellii.AAC.1
MSLDRDEGQELSAKQSDSVDANAGMLQYTLDKRYSYIRWQNKVNIVMGKKYSLAQCGKTYSPPQRRETP